METKSGRARTSPTSKAASSPFPVLSTRTERSVQSPPARTDSGTPLTVRAGPSVNSGSSSPPGAPAILVAYEEVGELPVAVPTRPVPSAVRSNGTTGVSAAKLIRTSIVRTWPTGTAVALPRA